MIIFGHKVKRHLLCHHHLHCPLLSQQTSSYLTPLQRKMDVSLVLFVVNTAEPSWDREDEHVSKTAARASRGFHDPCPEPIITF